MGKVKKPSPQPSPSKGERAFSLPLRGGGPGWGSFFVRLLFWLLLVTAVTTCQSPPDPLPTVAATTAPEALSQVTTSAPTGYPSPGETAESYPPPTLPIITEPYPGTTPTAELIFTPPPLTTLDGSEVR